VLVRHRELQRLGEVHRHQGGDLRRRVALAGDEGRTSTPRVMARLRAESQTDAAERAIRARQRERARYRKALLELHSWRRSMLRLLTLDTLGIAVCWSLRSSWPGRI